MGCAASSIDKDERVHVCKERKRLLKQLLGFRGEFANSILAYLKALKNTGATLRQFAESESLELENVPFSSGLPPSPPPPLPPSPPPPPSYSPDLRKLHGNHNVKEAQEEIIEIGDDSSSTPPPPCIPSSSWDPWDPFGSFLTQDEEVGGMVEEADEEKWAETRSQFEDEDQEHVTSYKAPDALPTKPLNIDVLDDDSSITSGQSKHMVDMAIVVWRSKKTLPGIVKELDDYFLKASAGGKEIAVLVDIGMRNTSLHHDLGESKRNGNNSVRALSSLTWSWSSRSLYSTRDAVKVSSPIEPCKPGSHCITLEKLYTEEQILHKAVREEEIAKLQHERKSLSLQKQEVENSDLSKIEKTRVSVDNLGSDIERLQELVRRTCSSILTLIEDELHPQLVALLSGLIHMWRTMYECHQVQSHISQQVKHLTSHHDTEPTTEYHREAAVQLENEVNFWYNSFCRFAKSQREYVKTLCRWVQLTDCLVNGENQNHFPSAVHILCKKWELALDRLPEKVVSEAIKSFLLVIQAIILQHEEECNLKKKSDKLERRLHKELNSLIEMEKKLELSVGFGDMDSGLSPKHPLSVKRAKAEALKKRHENEKVKYLSSIQVSRAMTLNNLQTTLPHVFHALMDFSNACTQAFEIALNHAQQASDVDQSHAD